VFNVDGATVWDRYFPRPFLLIVESPEIAVEIEYLRDRSAAVAVITPP
jgi:hypothetical protein